MNQLKPNPLRDKSYLFAIEIVKICQNIINEKKEFVLSKQLLRSGTSIGANIEEANQAESKSDFIHKLSVSNKEAFETYYWLRILRDTNYIESVAANHLLLQCEELLKILTASIKSAKGSRKK
ncbi:MAG: four helix bundle protein [Bacteroidota bacterium]